MGVGKYSSKGVRQRQFAIGDKYNIIVVVADHAVFLEDIADMPHRPDIIILPLGVHNAVDEHECLVCGGDTNDMQKRQSKFVRLVRRVNQPNPASREPLADFFGAR